MFCTNCGKELAATAILCPNCGAPTNPEETGMAKIEQKEKNDMALIGFIFSFFSPIAGLILGCIGLQRAKKLSQVGRGFAIASIAIGAGLTLLSFIYGGFLYSALLALYGVV